MEINTIFEDCIPDNKMPNQRLRSHHPIFLELRNRYFVYSEYLFELQAQLEPLNRVTIRGLSVVTNYTSKRIMKIK